MALSAALRDRGVRWIGGGWLAFLTENLVLSHNREEIIARIGDDRYHQIYNTLSTCACASILYGYTKYGRGKVCRNCMPKLCVQGLGFLKTALGPARKGACHAHALAPAPCA